MSWKTTLCIVALAPLAVALVAADEKVTIQGTILGIYDQDDNVVGIFIQTEDQGFPIRDDGKGKELTHLLGKRVEVRGTLSKGADGDFGVHVTAFKLVSK